MCARRVMFYAGFNGGLRTMDIRDPFHPIGAADFR